MASSSWNEPQPSGPQGWKTDYAKTDAVSRVPFKANTDENKNAGFVNTRDVYLDSKTVLSGHDQTSLFTDVLAITEKKSTVRVPASGYSYIFTRVLTASEPTHLEFNPEEKDAWAVYIHASVLDTKFTCSVAGSDASVNLKLGTDSPHVSVLLSSQDGHITTEYYDKYSAISEYHDFFRESLETQLRIATVLFWSKPAIALSLASHVAVATASNSSGAGARINMQAVALGQQLAMSKMTGPNMGYAPVLQINSYQQTLKDAIEATEAFETQYNRFQDKSANVEDLRKVGMAMLEQAKSKSDLTTALRDMAFGKYKAALDAARNTQGLFEKDRYVLQNASLDLQRGIERWQEAKRIEAAVTIMTAVIGFAIAIGGIFVGSPAGAAGVAGEVKDTEKAIEEVKNVKNRWQEFKQLLQSDTMKKLKDCGKALADLVPTVQKSVSSVANLKVGSSVKLPTTDKVSGADGDSAAIQSIAAWDKWGLESDEQLQYAVDQKIGGASAYRLALRKHAINGKQLAQAQAEAIKAGQEYVRAGLAVHFAESDIDNLEKMVQGLTTEKSSYEVAKAQFFDTFLSLRTGVCIDMLNLIWAEKYLTLSDSTIVVDPLKTVAEYKADLSQIQHDILAAQSKYASDFQDFTYKVPPEHLPANYIPDIVNSLKSHHSASFVLAPFIEGASAGSSHDNLSGPFIDGSHFRIYGMEVTLLGAKPTNADDQTVTLKILTSGTYADVQGNQAFNFTSLPLDRTFRYLTDAEGNRGEVEVEAIYMSDDYTMPTPFTQWTIKVEHADSLDLSKLESVQIMWKGKARFQPPS